MSMSIALQPPLWLLISIVGLPQLSETIYTPVIPSIARSFGVSHESVEYTLTIYLFGFALGTLFWGKFSDKYGRKPSLVAGLSLYILGCFGCFYSSCLSMLMTSRLVQALGGSTGSVLGQAICRDAFTESERGKVFSTIGSALAFSPIIGPFLGGIIVQGYQWPMIFLVLICAGIVITIYTIFKLPETFTSMPFSLEVVKKITYQMILDKKVIVAGFLVGACNGISFSYFAEGPFYLITLGGLSPLKYGISFAALALAGMLGSYTSKKLHDLRISSVDIMNQGTPFVLFGTLLLTLGALMTEIFSLSYNLLITVTLISMSLIMVGIGIIIPNILSIALNDYKSHKGTASSLFGFYYYCLISFFTLMMGLLHNGTLTPMPLFFLCISVGIYKATKYIDQIS